MHNKFLKGIASVLSAALVLGSVFTGVVPAKAASVSTKSDNGYETTYDMSELTIESNKSWGRPSSTEPQGTALSLTFSGSWSAEFFTIPAEVLEAGLKGAKITYAEPNDNIGIKLAGDHEYGWDILVAEGQTEITTDPDKIVTVSNGTAVPDSTRYKNYQGDRTPAHIPSITAIGIVQTGSSGCTVVANSITFITEKAINAADEGDGQSSTGSDESSANAGSTKPSYTPDQLTKGYMHDTITVDGNKFTFGAQYNQLFYAIPKEVIDAGLVGFYYTGAATGKFALKIVNSADVWNTILSDKFYDSYDAMNESNAVVIEADQRSSADMIDFMSNEEGVTLTIDKIIFITENPVGGATSADPGTTDPGTTDPGTTEPGTTDPGTTEPGTTDPEPTVTVEKPAKVTGLKATGAKGKVTLTWNEADNATQYIVYRSTSKTGTYKKVKTVAKTSFTDKNLSAKTKYFYKVKAVNKTDSGKATGKASAVKSAKTK